MARYPNAMWRPLPENATQGRIDPDQIILHSAVDAPGPTSLYGFFGRADVKVESHFFVKLDGRAEQYMDTNVRADANLESNGRAISIETEDEGNPNQIPWTNEQLVAIQGILVWAFATHPKTRRRICPDAYSPGVGYHSMWGTGPTPWIPYSSRGKTCPGTVRIAQFETVIVPWLIAPEPPAPQPEDDSMFFYDLNVNGVTRLVQVAGGKQTRVIGATYSKRCRESVFYLGLADDQQGDWYVKNYGPVVGL